MAVGGVHGDSHWDNVTVPGVVVFQGFVSTMMQPLSNLFLVTVPCSQGLSPLSALVRTFYLLCNY
jgi:hypothetical protein